MKTSSAQFRPGLRWFVSIAATVLASTSPVCHAQETADWISLGGFPGAYTDGFWVSAAVVDNAGCLYIGGPASTLVGDVDANGIARWDGTNWSALGSGMNGWVRALATAGTDVYAAGDFSMAGGTNANGIAKWDGTRWSPLGPGLNNVVRALAVSSTNVYAGGDFGIAKWDGSTWSSLGSGVGGRVFALAVSGTNLYAGGSFSTAGGNPANRIAKWDGSSWSTLGSGVDSDVITLAVAGLDLYAGGWFTNAGGTVANRIAKWNGSTWSALGDGLVLPPTSGPSYVYALLVSGTNLYAGGNFSTAGGVAATNIARWNGSDWSAVESEGPELLGTVFALAASGTNLYAGGQLSVEGSFNIARWDGRMWSALHPTSGVGFNARILALAASGTELYAGGDFTLAGGAPANRVAKWDGSTWSALGSGMNPRGAEVYVLAASGSDLYAGGAFPRAGDVPATNIARWNGTAWSGLGSGLNGIVEALAMSGTELYAGGSFTMAGSTPVNGIAKWNGSGWSALGSGMALDPPTGNPLAVYAVATVGTDLYAGGRFNKAGGVNAFCIAKWNGSTWSALGSGINTGINNVVYSLAASGTDLYVGGVFTTAAGAPANRIAKWNGSSWSALGSGMNGLVDALAVRGADLYAGGYFSIAGGIVVNHMAKWDGSTWSPMGLGMNHNVYALAVHGIDLYAGGAFTMTGNKVSAYAAKAALSPLIVQNVTEGNTGTSNAIITFVLSSNHTEIVSVDYTTVDGTAVGGSDYVPQSGTIMFAPSETRQNIVIPVLGDFVDENDEIFYLRLSNPRNITLSVTQAVVTIADDDTTLAITEQPTNQTVPLGRNAIFGVSAISSQPITYQWRFNGTAIPGATGTMLVVSNATELNEGSYTVECADPFRSIVSPPATLTVLVPPSLMSPVPPLNLGAVLGEQVNLGVQVRGTLPMFCRWRVFRGGGSQQALSDQVLTQRLSFLTFNVAANSAGTYVVHLTNSASGLATLAHTNAFLNLLADVDADGLPDLWEAAYPAASDPALDADNDGLTNLEEYRAGTDPTNAASVLKLDHGIASNLATLAFHAISNKTYTVQYTNAFGVGAWSKLADAVARSTNHTETTTDPTSATKRFYRLVTPRQQ